MLKQNIIAIQLIIKVLLHTIYLYSIRYTWKKIRNKKKKFGKIALMDL